MSSKFIPKSRISNKPNPVFNNTKKEDMWYSFATSNSPAQLEEEKEDKRYREKQLAEKKRIESISLEELTFRDLYEFPFHQAKYGGWVYDAKGNFIFQFEFDNKETKEKIINILNGEVVEYNRQEIRVEDGYISININGDWLNAILIRGWGNLTGVGAYNLDGKYAARIQDTLAEYIVEKLNKYDTQ